MDSNVASNAKTTGGITGKGFQPGKSGNPNGRPKKSLFHDLMDQAFDDPVRAKQMAEKVISKILEGDVVALKEAWARRDGPIKQEVELSGSVDTSGLTPEERQAKIEALKAKSIKRAQQS